MCEHSTQTELWRVGGEVYRVTTWVSGAWSIDWLDDGGEWIELADYVSGDDCLEEVLEVICAGI